MLRLTSVLSPAMVNQARISFQRIIQDGSDTVPYTPQQIGLKPMVDITCCNGTTGGTYTQPPVMNIAGAFNIGSGLNPSFAPTTQIQYSDQLSWNKGTHTFRAGFEYENVRWPLTFGGLGRGFLLVNSFPDLLIGRAGCAPADTTCSVANPGNTTGGPLSSFNGCLFCVRSNVNGIIHNYQLQNMSAFFQDDWKVNTRLTRQYRRPLGTQRHAGGQVRQPDQLLGQRSAIGAGASQRALLHRSERLPGLCGARQLRSPAHLRKGDMARFPPECGSSTASLPPSTGSR